MKRKLTALATFMATMCMAVVAMAEETGGVAGATSKGRGFAILGLMIGMGLATFGGSLGQGKAAASALEGIARNPEAAGKVQTPMIIGLALIESLVLYSLLVALLLLGKV